MRPGVYKAFVALGVLAGAATHVPTGAQPPAAPTGLTVRGRVEGGVVEGRIRRVDQRARSITLENGQEYLVAPPLTLNWALVPAGSTVKMRYSVDGGRRLATSIEVRP